MRFSRLNLFRLFTLLISSLIILACALIPSPSSTPVVIVTETYSPEITLTPSTEPYLTPADFGSPENPLTIGILAQTGDPQITSAAQNLAALLSNLSGYSVQGRFFSNYPDMLTAMDQSEIHIVFLPPLTYLWSYHNGFAIVGLLANHYGTYSVATQFLANRDSQFNVFFDSNTNRNTADISTALQQFSGKVPCWEEPSSISGYILPASLLLQQEISALPGINVQAPSAVIRALYIKGICDFGATYALAGDPRTGTAVLQDLPDAMDRVEVIWRSDPIIPNMNVSYLVDLSAEMRENLNLAFLDLIKDPQGKDALSKSLNYEINDLKVIDNTEYDRLRASIDLMDIDLNNLIGK